MTVAAAAADYATVVTACRRCLAHGTNLTGAEVQLVIDVVETAANTLDSKSAAAVAALEALLVTHLGILVADGASPTQGHVNAAVTALATPRATAVTASTASVADVTQNDALDGRYTAG